MTFTKAGTSYAELNAVLDQARRPSAHPAPVTDAQLLGLQHRWATALSARLDEAIEFTQLGQEVQAVAGAWRTLATDLDTLRGVLDAHEADSPELTRSLRVEYRMLAMAAGLAGLQTPVDEAARVGREFRELIRTDHVERTPELARAS
ncbi:hypothetical protein ACTXG6_21530 [Pseudonocardia sp. Cha107L01]|jgi:hypothetical protein|uniref:hypothetical protein n=1 Tax=Pseudonocardia sp. Cha107L01 TaxID=3457576 RepID=UPI0028CA726B|nr:hypothetical protein [Pseudonocardiales bacterium]MDT7666678.1 hypothetical protein [Pseudonocardiales bacterium]MDT7692503.1 hypothetical protein [Pseudonocardiales bacterium]